MIYGKNMTIDLWYWTTRIGSLLHFTADQFALNVSDPDAIQWIQTTAYGKAWAASAGF